MKRKTDKSKQTNTNHALTGQRTLTRARPLSKWLWLVAVFVTLCIFMHVKVDMWLHSDASAIMLLARQLNKEGAILSQNWCYATELWFLHVQLVFTPLFSFFSDWHTIRMVATIILYAILFLSYFYFCRQAKLSHICPWTAPILLIPFSSEYFDLVLFQAIYLPAIVNMFGVMGLVFHTLHSKEKWKRYLLLGVASVISCLYGVNGMREILVFYIPLFLCAFILWIANALVPDESSSQGDKYTWQARFLMIVSVITFFAGIGCLYNAKILSQFYIFDQHELVDYQSFSLAALEKLISGCLEVMGYNAGGSIYSVSSLLHNVSCGLMFLTVIAAFAYLCRKFSGLTYNEQIVVIFSACSIAVFSAFYLLTSMSYRSRYAIPTTVSVLPVVGIFFFRCPWKSQIKKVVCALLAAIITFSGFTYTYQRSANSVATELKPIGEQLVSEGYHKGYASFWNADIMTELTNGQLDMYAFGADLRATSIDQLRPWLQLKDHVENPPQGKLFAVFSASELKKWPLAQRLARGEIFYQDGSYTVCTYDSYEVMVKLQGEAGLPAKEQEVKTDYPSSYGFTLQNAALNKDNELVSDGTEGFVLYGPYTDSIPGTYEITLHYAVESYTGADSGSFDIALDAVPYRETQFTAAENTAVLEKVEIEAGHEFEVRVFVPEGMMIRIQSIDYKRIGS